METVATADARRPRKRRCISPPTASQPHVNLHVLALLAVATAMAVVMACGGTEPSEVIVQDNLHEAPASAHTVSTSEITIKFWYDVTPPRNSAIAPGTGMATFTMFCRRSRYLTDPSLNLHLEFDHIAIDGSASLFTPFGNSSGLPTFSCGAGSSHFGSSPIPATPTFAGLREVRVSAWILSDEERDAISAGQGSPTTPPDGVFVETINWTVAP